MSVELVTGYYGVGEDGEPNRHVSSAEDGARQAGTVGLGCYVLSTGSKMSAIMEDANTLLVSDGDALINGRHVRIPDSLSFTIPTGVQGRRVSNLAVLRYEVGADSVESVTPVVLTGAPSTGEPTDPEYNDGSVLEGASIVDMPIYRVVTNGTNYETPVLLPRVVKPLDDLKTDLDETGEEIRDEMSLRASSRRGQLMDISFSSLQSLPPGAYSVGDGEGPVVGDPSKTKGVTGWVIVFSAAAARVSALLSLGQGVSQGTYVTSGVNADNWVELAPRRIVASGSKVVEFTMPVGGGWAVKDDFLSATELRSMLGRAYDSTKDAICLWNADWNAANIIPMPFARTPTDGDNVGVYVTSPVTWAGSGRKSSARIGYMVVRGD